MLHFSTRSELTYYATPLGLYFTRASWLPVFGRVLPETTYRKLSPSFRDDVEAGLRSVLAPFDLSGGRCSKLTFII